MFLRKNEEEGDVIHDCNKTDLLELLYLIYHILYNKILYTLIIIIIIIDGLIKLVVPLL